MGTWPGFPVCIQETSRRSYHSRGVYSIGSICAAMQSRRPDSEDMSRSWHDKAVSLCTSQSSRFLEPLCIHCGITNQLPNDESNSQSLARRRQGMTRPLCLLRSAQLHCSASICSASLQSAPLLYSPSPVQSIPTPSSASRHPWCRYHRWG